MAHDLRGVLCRSSLELAAASVSRLWNISAFLRFASAAATWSCGAVMTVAPFQCTVRSRLEPCAAFSNKRASRQKSFWQHFERDIWATCFRIPEANRHFSRTVDPQSKTPAFKCVVVRVAH